MTMMNNTTQSTKFSLEDLLTQAHLAHKNGDTTKAIQLYQTIIENSPDNVQALHLLAIAHFETKKFKLSREYFEKAIRINPNHPNIHSNYGNLLQALKQYQAAIISYDQALQITQNTTTIMHKGFALQALQQHEAALTCFNQYINFTPNDVQLRFVRANLLHELKQFDQALIDYDFILQIYPHVVEILSNKANTLVQLKRYKEALDAFNSALYIQPNNAVILFNRGNLYQTTKDYQQALQNYDAAIALMPNYAQAFTNRGIVLRYLKQLSHALTSYDQALSITPDCAVTFFNRAGVLQDLYQHDQAIDSYSQAIAINPTYTEAIANRASTYRILKQHQAAFNDYDRAFQLNQEFDFLPGIRHHAKMSINYWNNFDEDITFIRRNIQQNKKTSAPFPVLSVIASSALHQQCATLFAQEKCQNFLPLPAITQRYQHSKIRIAYFSSDFYNHATAHLMAELFEKHDRTQFEIFAFSFGQTKQDALRQRLINTFDHFIDIEAISDIDATLLARQHEIDIAIDLKGFTWDARPNIFALRAAPIQINYLGYPGTMGAHFIDYLIADHTLIPTVDQQYYNEKIIYLPHTYQSNDTTRPISDHPIARADCGLPENAFVFCCFNNNYKITPHTFDSWVNILNRVPKSVLWLFEDNSQARENLHKEAKKRGLSVDKIFFAERMEPSKHLARHRVADLFLDTLPYGAHTTASDALWAGLPVLTQQGNTFAGRVAASLLNAIDMPELITHTQTEYENLAVELALHPQKLNEIKQKLHTNKTHAPLFNTTLFTKHIEQAYKLAIQRHQHNLPPEHINVPAEID